MSMTENELVAAAMRNPDVLWQVEAQPEHFTSAVLSEVWRTMQAMQGAGEKFDAVTLAQALPGHEDRIITIANDAIGSPAAAGGYAKKLIADWTDRTAGDIYAQAIDRQITRDEAIRALMALDQTRDQFECTIQQAMKRALADMEEAQAAGGALRGITTGLADLDKTLGGWHDGDLVVIGARPAMGKTALMLHHAQSCKMPLGVVSSEQPAHQIAQRHIASIGKTSLSNLRQGKIGEHEMNAVIQANRRLKEYWMLDRSSPSITDVERTARRWHHKHGIKILFVDYIQRIRGVGDKRHEQVGDVVRGLKTLARDLNIPVVALAQVGRDVERRTNRRPGMADLADSSEIEKEADQVITLYRDEVYDADSPHKGIAELGICKNRHGYVGTVHVEWRGEFVSFGDLNKFGGYS
jgi:replicative DNA helicase